MTRLVPRSSKSVLKLNAARVVFGPTLRANGISRINTARETRTLVPRVRLVVENYLPGYEHAPKCITVDGGGEKKKRSFRAIFRRGA